MSVNRKHPVVKKELESNKKKMTANQGRYIRKKIGGSNSKRPKKNK